MRRLRSFKPTFPLRQKTILIILGFFLTAIILEVGLRLGGFILLSFQENKNRASLRQKSTYRILCLGESTTQQQWPPLLEETLNQSNIGIKFSVIDKAIFGTTTSVILAKLESNLNAYQPDMVITMMGINDQGPHLPYESVSDSKGINFLKSFRIYKLTRLLWLHIVTKLKEIGLYRLSRHATVTETSLPSEESLRLKKTIGLDPGNARAYTALARLYQEQGQFSQAEALYRKAIELDPENDNPYIALGLFYLHQGRLSEAEESYRKAIELDPGNDNSYRVLGCLYLHQGKLSEAEALVKKALELDPGNASTYIALAGLYQVKGKLSEAEASYRKAIALDPSDGTTYAALESLYEDMGKPGLAIEYGRKAKERGLHYYAPSTITNYRKLKAILDKRGIVYVCAQYPMRPLKPLQTIFEGQRNVIFVDNEKVFKDAVDRDGHREYFVDIFGGDFGHCTKKGNRILAENIAKVILKEVFSK